MAHALQSPGKPKTHETNKTRLLRQRYENLRCGDFMWKKTGASGGGTTVAHGGAQVIMSSSPSMARFAAKETLALRSGWDAVDRILPPRTAPARTLRAITANGYAGCATPITDFLTQLQRGKSIENAAHRLALARDSHRSYDGLTRSLNHSSRESKSCKQNHFNDLRIFSKSVDSAPVATDKSLKCTDEKSVSSLSVNNSANDWTPKIELEFYVPKSHSRMASTGDQMGHRHAKPKRSYIADLRLSLQGKIKKNTKRDQTAAATNVMAEIHKSVQYMDIIEHDAELEQDLSSRLMVDETTVADPRLNELLQQLAQNENLDSEKLVQEIAGILRSQTDPIEKAAIHMVELAKKSAFLNEVLSKKNNLENVYLAEINKLQAEVSRLSQASTSLSRSQNKMRSDSNRKFGALRSAVSGDCLSKKYRKEF